MCNKLRPQCAGIASATEAAAILEETVSGPFAGIKLHQKIRYALLAGTMLPAVAIAPAGMAADALSSAQGVIILAQAPAIDPATGKPLPKGAQPQPKAGQPQPKAAVQPQPQPNAVQPQPKAVQSTPTPGGPPPGGTPPAGAGTPPPSGVQKQLGGQPKGPLQGQQNIQHQNIQQGVQTQTPTGQGVAPKVLQKQQTGVQQKGVQPLQGQQNIQQNIQQGTQTPPVPAPGQGTPPAGLQKQQIGVQQKGIQPIPGQQNVVPGAQPLPGQAAPAQGFQQKQFGGLPKGPGGAQPLAVTGNVDQLRVQRQERKEAGGRIVIEEPGRRFIVREGTTTIIRHDENERFRLWGAPRMERRGAEQFAYIARPGGYQIVNVTDANGRLLRRMRRGPDGREVIIIDNRGPGLGVGLGVGLAAGVILGLAAPAILIPREQYIVDVSAAPPAMLYETLEAPPLVAIERPYSLDEIRYNVALRDRMRRVDIDSITFDTGSWEVTPEQQERLQAVAGAIQQVLSQNPNEVFMVEGHTDAVGNDVDNLSLSDRRAESVAVILTNNFQIPPENLVTQGYGEQFLKIPTDGPARENRRVTVRRITPLLQGGVASR
jgi:outer membrane protein OmpA-like peptidoglycan-associated protein